MKKILAMLAVFFMLVAVNSVNAATYSDVPADYWANKEITAIVESNILPLKNNAFNPTQGVSRSVFNSALLRTLGHRNTTISESNPFSDVVSSRSDYGDILLSSKLGLIYGYEDGTFKPDRIMTKAEAASVISHITKEYKGNSKSLNGFTDKDSIPAWATAQYAKTIDLGIYVNHPNADELLPNKKLDKAEAAVLLYQLKNKLNAVQEKYVNKEIFQGEEHLDVTKKAEVDTVLITNQNYMVKAKNMIKGYFATYFSSNEICVGTPVSFKAKENIYTKEGTLIIPEGSIMKAKVTSIEPKKWWNKNDKVTVEFESLTLPCGTTVPFKANVLNHNGVLTENRWAKPVGYTVGGAIVGGGAGVGVAGFTGHHHYGNGVAIGVPVGAGLGLLTGLTTPGRTFKANDRDYVWLELTDDLIIPRLGK